ncbi:hypothetical protein E2C01_031363 [Portunus trituberculatus]|uniref:Uncharacterized protein n=1 Tax=Portunus trituberculatus TaxID=210409 RepID=A0A5B7EXG9_PORTR|nr:hypothetical protein [Portunus trituberculatus]
MSCPLVRLVTSQREAGVSVAGTRLWSVTVTARDSINRRYLANDNSSQSFICAVIGGREAGLCNFQRLSRRPLIDG